MGHRAVIKLHSSALSGGQQPRQAGQRKAMGRWCDGGWRLVGRTRCGAGFALTRRAPVDVPERCAVERCSPAQTDGCARVRSGVGVGVRLCVLVAVLVVVCVFSGLVEADGSG